MMADPIVEEIHRIREELAAKEGHDLRRIIAAAKRRQDESGRQVVELPPKRVLPRSHVIDAQSA